jgi:tetratricopeptide (TPR) repeat protein
MGDMASFSQAHFGQTLFGQSQADAVLGHGLPPQVERLLGAAGEAYHCEEEAERCLNEAYALAPDHAAVLIGFYRFYFYKGRLGEALGIARLCLAKAARETGLSGDWWLVGRDDADFGSFEAVLPRFFMFTLKGYAYLLMRLGQFAEARLAIMKLIELDFRDRIGAKVLLGVLERMESGEDED